MSTEAHVESIVRPLLRNVRVSSGELQASCPFHRTSDPDNPSRTLFISLSLGVYHCWSCGASGSLAKFLHELGRPPEAISAALGGGLEEQLKHRLKSSQTTKEKFIHEELSSDVLPESLLGVFDRAPKLLLEDGFTKETLRHFEVGYDRWNYRITYPVRAIDGRLLGIVGGQVYPEDNPKYLLYTKEFATWGLGERGPIERGETLWHAHRMYADRASSANNPPLVLVEGYKACMWVYQSGIPDVIALSGSKITFAQRTILGRMAQDVVLMLDGDEAGRAGARQIQQQLQRSGLRVHRIDLPDETQPDDLEPDWLKETLTWDCHQPC